MGRQDKKRNKLGYQFEYDYITIDVVEERMINA